MKIKLLSLLLTIIIWGTMTSCSNLHQDEISENTPNGNNIKVDNSVELIKVGSLNNYSPIILNGEAIIYYYFSDYSTLSVGKYDIQTKEEISIGEEDSFSLTHGIPALIDDIAYLPITLESGEHNLLSIDIKNESIENIFSDYNSEPLDSIAAMNDEIYMLSNNFDENGVYTSYIRKCNRITHSMDVCILKESANKSNGEVIKSFACNDGKIYVFIEKRDNSNSDIYIDVYDNESYNCLNTLYFDEGTKSLIKNNYIAQFYSFGDYIYIRDFSDYGFIGIINGNNIRPIIRLPQLRIAYNNKNTKDDFYFFFVRESNEFFILDIENNSLLKADMPLSINESVRNAISDGSNLCVSILDESITDSFVTKETYICSYNYLLGLSVDYTP